MDHLALQNEIAAELGPLPIVAVAPARRREGVLNAISQAAQLTKSFVELANEAGFLTADVLELDLFAGAEILTKDSARLSMGSVADSANNITPNLCNMAWGNPRSVFQFAVLAKHPIIIADLPTDPRFDDSLLTEHGVRSGIVCPIQYKGETFGAIGCFATHPRSFERPDVLFLQSVALFLGPAHAHQKHENALAEHSRFLSSAIDSLDAIVVLLGNDGGVLQINRGCQNLGGFKLSELRGRKIWSAYWQPDESAEAESAIAELRAGARIVKREASFLTKLGAVRRVAWTFSRLQEPADDGSTILATGIDITEQHNAVNRLKEAQHTGKQPRPRDANGPESASSTIASAANANRMAGLAEASASERRVHDRRQFQCIQMVAPCSDGRLPDLEQFREVRCYDISPRGFSFLLGTRPTFEELVATFGSATSRLYLRAHIRHITPIQFEGRKVLLIGCEYVGRVRISKPAK